MNNNINFNVLWANQTLIEPNTEDLFSRIKKMKQSNLKQLIRTNMLLIATSVFIIFIWIYYQPQFLSTKIGIVLIIMAMATYLLVYNKSYSLFKDRMNTQSNRDYLRDLLAIKFKQQFMQSTMLNIYFILLSAGIGLYMYEYASRMTILWGLFTYGITSIWILFSWFYLRPKQIKKQQSKLDEIISDFKLLNKQFEA
jgi:hypothetical protein